MSKKEVKASQQTFVVAKKPKEDRPEPLHFDGGKLNKTVAGSQEVKFLYIGGGKPVNGEIDAFAKKVIDGKRSHYFVKYGTFGGEVGHMLNPWGMSYQAGDEKVINSNSGKFKYEFREVNQEVFDGYLRFLETRNEGHLLKAERANA